MQLRKLLIHRLMLAAALALSIAAAPVYAAEPAGQPVADVTQSEASSTSSETSRDTAAQLVLAKLKEGHPEESAKLIREMLLIMQLELQADPRYKTDPVTVMSESPGMLKSYFAGLIAQGNEKSGTGAIIDSLIDNTVPKNYPARLKSHFAAVKSATDKLNALKAIADSEELKYGDPHRSLDDSDPEVASNPAASAANLEKLAKTLTDLANVARYMPVADLQPALGLYRLTLVANSAKLYKQAEIFAVEAISQIKGLTGEDYPAMADIQLALTYSLMKQNKMESFDYERDMILLHTGGRERLVVALARFTEYIGDIPGAVQMYKRILEKRTATGITQPPEWMDNYNTLFKKLQNEASGK